MIFFLYIDAMDLTKRVIQMQTLCDLKKNKKKFGIGTLSIQLEEMENAITETDTSTTKVLFLPLRS